MTTTTEVSPAAVRRGAAERLSRDALAATVEHWMTAAAMYPTCGRFDYQRTVLQLSKIDTGAVPHINPARILDRCVAEGADAVALVIPVFDDDTPGAAPRVLVFCCMAGETRQVLTATHRVTATGKPGEYIVDEEPESLQWSEPQRRHLH